jgi:hypothetical protein
MVPKTKDANQTTKDLSIENISPVLEEALDA